MGVQYADENLRVRVRSEHSRDTSSGRRQGDATDERDLGSSSEVDWPAMQQRLLPTFPDRSKLLPGSSRGDQVGRQPSATWSLSTLDDHDHATLPASSARRMSLSTASPWESQYSFCSSFSSSSSASVTDSAKKEKRFKGARSDSDDSEPHLKVRPLLSFLPHRSSVSLILRFSLDGTAFWTALRRLLA